MPVTVVEESEACTVFARSKAGFVGSNSTQGTDVWYVYVFILCLCCPVFRRPCDGLITRPRSPIVCKMIIKLNKSETRVQGGCRASEKLYFEMVLHALSICFTNLCAAVRITADRTLQNSTMWHKYSKPFRNVNWEISYVNFTQNTDVHAEDKDV
jgi:hypothetical protein